MPANYPTRPHEALILIALVMVGSYLPVLTLAGAQPSQAPFMVTTWGGAEDDYGYSVAVTGDGIYIVGATESYAQRRVGAFPSNDIFIAKFDFDGKFLWNRTWGGSEDDEAYGVAIGEDGIYVAGETQSYALARESLVLKYDANGNLLWAMRWHDFLYNEGCRGIALTGSAIYTAGMVAPVASSNWSVFLAKHDPSGDRIWYSYWNGTDDGGSGVGVGNDGIYVTGKTNLVGAGDFDAFLLKFDTSGNLLWDTSVGGTAYDSGNGIAVGESGIYITGSTRSYGEGADVLVAKFDSSGNLLWYRTWGGHRDEWGSGITVGDGYVYVVGETRSLWLGGNDAFLLKYDANGDLLLNVTWGGSKYDGFSGVAVDSDVPYMTGYTNSFGAGRYDAIVLRYVQPRASTNIALSLSRDTLDLGQPLALSGNISPSPGSVKVTLTYTRPNGSAVTRDTLTSGEGAITYTYVPAEEGEWSVRAGWLGNEEFTGATSSSYRFTVRPPFPLSYVAAGAIAVLALAMLLIWRGKRSQEPPPPPFPVTS